MKLFQLGNLSEKTWRALANLWTFVTMGFFVADFFSSHRYGNSSAAVAIIYIAVLGIYAGTKEFDRWQNSHASKRMGELFIVLWTLIMIFFLIATPLSGNQYRIPSEFPATYIAVLSIFALTQRSKFLHRKKLTTNDKQQTTDD